MVSRWKRFTKADAVRMIAAALRAVETRRHRMARFTAYLKRD